MLTDLRCLVDNRHPYTVARIAGRLDSASAEVVRNGLLTCLAEQPEALIVDLTDMRIADRKALSVLLAVSRQTAIWPRIPMILCGAAPAVAHLLRSRSVGRIPTVRNVLTAVRSVAPGRAPPVPALTEDLLPTEGAGRRAREVATGACLRWDLPTLVGPSCTVVTELVNNVVAHAHTMMRLRISLRRRYLHIAVADGSSEPPQPRRQICAAALWGRGLALVDSVAAHWGSLIIDGGKVVWAMLEERPAARRDWTPHSELWSFVRPDCGYPPNEPRSAHCSCGLPPC